MRKPVRQLRYLTLFYDDLEQTMTYIADQLCNPQAALRLINDVEAAIIDRLPIAECFEPYFSQKDRQNKYYRIYVGNYIIYYVLLYENGSIIMEMRRFLYKGKNRDVLI